MSERLRLCGTAWVWLAIGLGAGQAGAGVAVSPLKQEISLAPGAQGKVTITAVHPATPVSTSRRPSRTYPERLSSSGKPSRGSRTDCSAAWRPALSEAELAEVANSISLEALPPGPPEKGGAR